MNKDQIKSFCSEDYDDPNESVTFSPNLDYVLLYHSEMVLHINFEEDFITTLQGQDHFGEWDVNDWSDVKVFKRVG